MTMQKRRCKKLACHDELTYEVLRMLQVFGPLSIPSLYKRCSQICKQNELMISEEYFREFLLSEMEKRRYITIKKEIVTGYVDRGKHRFMQDAFWVFLEFVEGMDMESVIDGPDPAQVSFQRNNALYHIVRCDSDGSLDYGPIYPRLFLSRFNAEITDCFGCTYVKSSGRISKWRQYRVAILLESISNRSCLSCIKNRKRHSSMQRKNAGSAFQF